MANVVPIRQVPLILCQMCQIKIGEGYTYGYLFYCDTCIKLVQVAEDTDD